MRQERENISASAKDKAPKTPGILTGLSRLVHSVAGRSRLGELLVAKGMLSPAELRQVLRLQKSSGTTIGQICLQKKLVTRSQLGMTVIQQNLLRGLAASILFMTSFTLNTGSAKAGIKDVAARIALTAEFDQARLGPVKAYPGLFGTTEKRSHNLKPFTKWTGMFERFDRELNARTNMQNIKEWQADLISFKGLDLKNMADRVNDMVNDIPYIVDSRNWGKSDYWATPVEFLERGGDCEDFAIAKYAALRSLGVPEERMRLAIVHDNVKDIPHAVLVVYTNQGAYVLDNQTSHMIRADEAGRYRPIFSINRTAWWLHSSPEGTVLASR